MRPLQIPQQIKQFYNLNYKDVAIRHKIKHDYGKIHGTEPKVSVVIPAYNEENNIVQTLASLSANIVPFPVEIIVVNNNSADRTEEFVNDCGVRCIRETAQGITNARNAGLKAARGNLILNADADTIYPSNWIKEMATPLEDSNVALTYGRFSFIPTARTGRTTYFFYEYMADLSRTINKYIKDEAVSVYGFNSGFRREQGLAVDSFNHPPGTNEDGWMAVKLRNKGFGRLHLVSATRVLAWTTDRRIQIDGGLFSGLKKRIRRIINLK